MTSCTSPRSATIRRYDGIASRPPTRSRGRAQLVDGLQQRDEADPRGAADEVDEPGLAGEHHRGEHVVDALGHRDDVALARLRAVPVEQLPDRHERPVRAGAAASDSGGGAGASGRRDCSSLASSRARCSGAGPRSASPARRAGRRAAPIATWWASACSRTSSVAIDSPSAATVRIARSTTPWAASSPRLRQQRVPHEQQVVEQLAGASRSPAPGGARCGWRPARGWRAAWRGCR